MNTSPKKFIILLAVIFAAGVATVFLWKYIPWGVSPSPVVEAPPTSGPSQNNTPGQGSNTPTLIPALPSSSAPTSSTSTTPIKTVQPLPYTATNFNPAEWTKSWGSITASTSLEIAALSTTQGGATFLTGSEGWTNYDVQIVANWRSGESLSVVARAKDNSNFVYCDFGDHYVSILERVNGEDTVLNSADTTIGGPGTQALLGARVYGGKVACTANGKDAVTMAMPSTYWQQGGIGFIAFDRKPGTSDVLIKKIVAVPLNADDIAILPPVVPAKPAGPGTTTTPTTTPAPTPDPTPTPTTTPAPTQIAFTIPYIQNSFANDTNWLGVWGKKTIDDAGAMNLSATAKTTGATVLLKNPTSWTNYTVTAHVDWNAGQTFALMGHYIDENNFVECSFAQPYLGSINMLIVQNLKGVWTELANGEINNYNQLGGKDMVAKFTIDGTQASCSLNNHVVATIGTGVAINPPYTGAVGISAWDPTPSTAQIAVRSVTIKENYSN